MPNGALLQVNRFCNLHCSHCSISAPRSRSNANLSDVTLRQWQVVLTHLKAVGITRVRFTGGEPFLRPDLEHICRYADQLSLEISFVTNGLLIHPKNVNWLKDVMPKSIWISIYGYPARIYEQITGTIGSFKRIVVSIKELIEHGLNIGVYYPLGSTNYESISEFIDFCYSIGVRYVKFVQILERGRAIEPTSPKPLSMRMLEIVLDMLIGGLPEIPSMTLKVSMRSGQSGLFRSRGFSIPKDRSCQIGLQNLWTVDSKGSISPCCLFLNKGELDLFNGLSTNEFFSWNKWDREAVLSLLGLKSTNIHACPALDESRHGDNATKISDFTCPLIYARITA